MVESFAGPASSLFFLPGAPLEAQESLLASDVLHHILPGQRAWLRPKPKKEFQMICKANVFQKITPIQI